jgi:hypothetical protein
LDSPRGGSGGHSANSGSCPGIVPVQPACSLNLVTDADCWRWLVRHRGHQAPPGGEFGILVASPDSTAISSSIELHASANAGASAGCPACRGSSRAQLTLPARARVELPLRCLSFEGLSTASAALAGPARDGVGGSDVPLSWSLADVEHTAAASARIFHVQFCRDRAHGNRELQARDVHVQAWPSPVDSSLRLYEPNGTVLRRRIAFADPS